MQCVTTSVPFWLQCNDSPERPKQLWHWSWHQSLLSSLAERMGRTHSFLEFCICTAANMLAAHQPQSPDLQQSASIHQQWSGTWPWHSRPCGFYEFAIHGILAAMRQYYSDQWMSQKTALKPHASQVIHMLIISVTGDLYFCGTHLSPKKKKKLHLHCLQHAPEIVVLHHSAILYVFDDAASQPHYFFACTEFS